MTINIPDKAPILITRTDAIGDVILTIPLTFFLKQKFPNSRIIFLATQYTQPILQYIQTIDTIITLEEIKNELSLYKTNPLKKLNIHTAIIAFPDLQICQWVYDAEIKNRIATSHRWYNWIFCNRLVSFTRKKSNLHEAQLNFKLLSPLGIQYIPSLSDLSDMYLFHSIPPLPSTINQYLDKHKFKVILHPKSRGSAREWGINNYINLIKKLDKSKFQIILTGTKNEEIFLEDIITQCPHVVNLVGKTTLPELIQLIHSCDALVAASTGTLHMAAILNKHAIGIFPPIKPMHPGRWAPIGKKVHILVNDKNCNACRKMPAHCTCIQDIQPETIAKILNTFI